MSMINDTINKFNADALSGTTTSRSPGRSFTVYGPTLVQRMEAFDASHEARLVELDPPAEWGVCEEELQQFEAAFKGALAGRPVDHNHLFYGVRYLGGHPLNGEELKEDSLVLKALKWIAGDDELCSMEFDGVISGRRAAEVEVLSGSIIKCFSCRGSTVRCYVMLNGWCNWGEEFTSVSIALVR